MQTIQSKEVSLNIFILDKQRGSVCRKASGVCEEAVQKPDLCQRDEKYMHEYKYIDFQFTQKFFTFTFRILTFFIATTSTLMVECLIKIFKFFLG